MASSATTSLALWPLIVGLFGGLALFLYGMDKMAEALKAVAGERMRSILGRLTSHRIAGALTGAFVTAILQSSSVTTVMVVGFITANLLTFAQSIGIIMGANIGTTITAQLLAFKTTGLGLVLVALGFALSLLGRGERARQYGAGLMGLGLVFFGMTIMGEAMAPLRSYPPFIEAMQRMASPALGILAGALFTAVVQSSSATTAVVIVMASQGLISLPAGIALIFGANVGTCVTALLATIGKPREATRAAIAHVLFNVAGVVIWLPFIGPLAELVVAVSPASPHLEGAARLAADTPRQIANAHTVFNVGNTLLLIGFVPQLAWLICRLVPDRATVPDERSRARYLDEELLGTPALALERVRLETLGMGEQVGEMLRRILPAVLDGDRQDLLEVRDMDDVVDELHGQVVTYLGKVSQMALTEAQTREVLDLMEVVNDLENIGDIVEMNLVGLGLERLSHQISVSPSTRELLTGFHDAVCDAVEGATQAVTLRSAEAAENVTRRKGEINRLAEAAATHQVDRLVAEEPNRLPAFKIESDLLQNLKRIYYFAKRMARASTRADSGTAGD